jgi:hypothetical protein
MQLSSFCGRGRLRPLRQNKASLHAEGDRYPHAPRLDPLRAALARLDAAAGGDRKNDQNTDAGSLVTRKAPPPKANQDIRADDVPKVLTPKAPPPAKADKRARR